MRALPLCLSDSPRQQAAYIGARFHTVAFLLACLCGEEKMLDDDVIAGETCMRRDYCPGWAGTGIKEGGIGRVGRKERVVFCGVWLFIPARLELVGAAAAAAAVRVFVGLHLASGRGKCRRKAGRAVAAFSHPPPQHQPSRLHARGNQPPAAMLRRSVT